MKRTKEEALDTKKKIMDAAIKVFSTRGYNKATLVDIAAEANLTRGALYWHFKSKSDLFIELSNAYGHKFVMSNIEKVLRNKKVTTIEKIKYGLENFFDMLETNEDFCAMEEMYMKIFESEDPVIKSYLKNEIKEIIEPAEFFIKTIKEGIKNNEIREDIDIKRLFNLLTTLLLGLESIWFMSGKNHSIKERGKWLIEPIMEEILKK